MAAFSALTACFFMMMISKVSCAALMACHTGDCISDSDAAGLRLLQRDVASWSKAKLPNHTGSAPVGLGVVPIATEFTDSDCTNETGHVYNLPLNDDPCDYFWTFTCTCDSQGYEALRGREWTDGDCESNNYTEYILPVGVCFKLPQMHNYISLSDFLLCEQCKKPASSLMSPHEAHTDIAEDEGDEEDEEPEEDESAEQHVSAESETDAIAASKSAESDAVEEDAAPPALLEAGPPQKARPGKQLQIKIYEDDDCKEGGLIHEYDEEPNECAAKLGGRGKPSVTYNCKCNGDKKEILYVKWFYDWCDPSGGVHYDYTFPAGKCVQSPTGLSWVKIHAQACPSCCTDASKCTVHGDPHITVFDGDDSTMVTFLTNPRTVISEGAGREDMFDWGDYWLVKSEQVLIQARYRKVYYPKATQPLNQTYLTAVAISGPFLYDHALIIEPRNGKVTWSRRADVSSAVNIFDKEAEMEFSRGDIITALYHNRTAVVPEGKDVIPGIDVELPSGVKVFVDRFEKHLDFQVMMPPEAGGPNGVDGQCGNYNGDASDDTADLIGRRIGFQVPPDELLFAKDSEVE